MEKGTTPTALIIFGITGDLATKKIIPSLWYLFGHDLLPERMFVVGVGRRELSEKDFRALIRDAIEKRSEKDITEDDFTRFCDLFSYQQGVFEDKQTFRSLVERIEKAEATWGVCGNKLMYLAVPPSLYETIFKHLAAVKLNLPCGGELGWSRILIEKPFGTDKKSAQMLQKLLASYFKEEQVYRIDHYLFKEIIQGIESFRFSNNLFEHTWDNTVIDRVDVHLCESIGVEGRGRFYDAVGALRDVGQNHVLEMLAAVTMEYPVGMQEEVVHKNRTELIRALAPWKKETLRKNTYRAQYRGYRDIEGVASDSETETYFGLKTELDHPRWAGVPIYMEAGKRMGEARKEIVLTLKHPKVCMLCQAGPHGPNRIVFRLEPNDEIVIHFWTKKPGFEHVLEERAFSFFLYEKEVKVQYVEEYAKVLHSAMAGNRAPFIAADEVEALWTFSDPISEAWQNNIVPLEAYEPDTAPEPPFYRAVPEELAVRKHTSKGTVGFIGLGRMGGAMVEQLLEKGYDCVVTTDTNKEAVERMKSLGARGTMELGEMISMLETPRVIWLMIPRHAVDGALERLVPLLDKGDTIIEGGNTYYEDSMRRAKELEGKGIYFLDVGVSGGIEGARHGACMMIGGDRNIFERHEHMFRDLCVEDGYGYMGASGSGHFVKMVHNAIEYGMMGAVAEGMQGIKELTKDFGTELAEVIKAYGHGSIIEGRLITEWLDAAWRDDPELSGFDGKVPYGETEEEMEKLEQKIAMPVLTAARNMRVKTRTDPSFMGKVLNALRFYFGGHTAKTASKKVL